MTILNLQGMAPAAPEMVKSGGGGSSSLSIVCCNGV